MDRKFHKKTGQRRSFRKSLAANLIMKGRMVTTVARAKDVRPTVERYVTLAKKNQTAQLRLLLAKLPKNAATKVFYEIAPKYKERNGGYLRITKLAKARMRDGSEMARIEFV